MTPPDDRRARLTAMFAGELADRTQVLEEGLLALERTPPQERPALLDELARAAHTLKGSAGMMGAAAVAATCHELEDTLVGLRNRDRVDPTTVSRLLDEVDRIRQAGAAHAGGPEDRPSAPPPPVTVTPAAPGDDPRPARPATPTTTADGDAEARTVRLPARKLDTLVRRAAELRTATSALLGVSERLTEAERDLRTRRSGRSTAATDDFGAAWTAAAAVVADVDRRVRPLLRHLDRAAGGIDAAVRDTVTVPVADACAGLRRTVRDIAEARDTRIRLELSVGDTGIDRRAIGVVRDALVHLVRNAADHGIEPSDVRVAAGKPAEGTVEVVAAVRGDRVVVTVRDDGRGIDAAAVTAAAEAAGLGAVADPAELVFTAGLSTASTATDYSGRGVGLDAVRAAVESLRGTVTLASEPGTGTAVTLTVPASLATARVLIVAVGDEQVALPVSGIHRLTRVRHDDVTISDDRAWVRVDGQLRPLHDLADLAGLPPGRDGTGDRRAAPALVVPGSGGEEAVLLVDAVVGEQELLVQPVGPLLEGLTGVVGTAVLARGQAVLLLHPAVLVRAGRQRPGGLRALPGTDPARAGRGRVLLAEDAPTTRALEQGLLEAAGYDVVAAADGRAAWELLRSETVDVVVSDVEMPHLGGLALCQRIRSSPTLRELPVVLVTSRDSEDDRRRGADAGADAYLVKSSFAQGELIATIARLLS